MRGYERCMMQSGHPADREVDRRMFVAALGTAGASLGVAAFAAEQGGGGGGGQRKEPAAEEVSPAEDLMREHGVLKRVLLVYEEAIRRIDAKQDVPPDTVKDAAGIVRAFIEDYHEKLEE